MDDMNEEYDLAKWLAGEIPEDELVAFEKSPGYKTYARIKKYSAQFEPPGVDEAVLYDGVVAKRKRRDSAVNVVPMYRRFGRVAAILLVALALGYFFTTVSTTEAAQNGQINSFSLPDNSRVVLNAGSEISYKKWRWSSNRKLTLEGEAFFKVAKGKQFEVSTDLGKVTVLGTQFNVRSRNDRFDVTCYEGKVKVNYGDAELVIGKGQSVAFAYGVAIETGQNPDTRPKWLDDKLAFNKEYLTNIVEEINRQYDVMIVLRNVYSNQLFTGVLPRKNLDEALHIIGSTYHLQIRKEEGKIILEALDAEN